MPEIIKSGCDFFGASATLIGFTLLVIWGLFILFGLNINRRYMRFIGCVMTFVCFSMLFGLLSTAVLHENGPPGGKLGSWLHVSCLLSGTHGLALFLAFISTLASFLLATDWLFLDYFLDALGLKGMETVPAGGTGSSGLKKSGFHETAPAVKPIRARQKPPDRGRIEENAAQAVAPVHDQHNTAATGMTVDDLAGPADPEQDTPVDAHSWWTKDETDFTHPDPADSDDIDSADPRQAEITNDNAASAVEEENKPVVTEAEKPAVSNTNEIEEPVDIMKKADHLTTSEAEPSVVEPSPLLGKIRNDEIETAHVERPDEQIDEKPKAGKSEALDLLLEEDEISVSLVQKRLGLGYFRAAKTIDRLEKQGILSAHANNIPRRVILSKEEIEKLIGEEGLRLEEENHG